MRGENMNSSEAFDLIYSLLEQHSHNNYYIDFSSLTFPNEDYFELEAFLDKYYKQDFSNKIKFIVLSIIYHYQTNIFLDSDVANALYPNLVNKDIRNIGLEELASIIDKMILENYSALNILFSNGDTTSLLRIEDGYDTYIFNLPDKEKTKIKELIDHQGLFLKRMNNNNWTNIK